MVNLAYWADKSSSMEASTQNIAKSNSAIQNAYSFIATLSFLFWACLVKAAYSSYGFSIGTLWDDIWEEANASVGFMTIDTGVLYLGILIFIGYENAWKALKALFLTPLVGPGAACCVALKDLENDSTSAMLVGKKKEI